MGTKRSNTKNSPQQSSSGLANALFSRVQQRVLGILFASPERSFYANEIIRLASSGSGAVQRELSKLEASGLITRESIGNQKHYRANPASPLFGEIRGLVLKTFGLADVLRDALVPVAGEIEAAFIYGSIAKSTDHAGSDIDLLLITDRLSYGQVMGLLEDAAVRLGRKVSPTLYSHAEFRERAAREDGFMKRVLEQPRIWIVGGEHELGA